MKKTGAVLVAAGMSSKMQEFKPMLPFGNSTISLHLVTLMKTLGLDPVVVVTGYRGAELEEHLSSVGVRFIKNERYERTQMFDSIKLGVEAIRNDCERILIMPMDIPAILPETFRQILRIDAELVRSCYEERPAHPIVIQSQVADRILAYQGDQGLRGAIADSGISITNVEVDDEAVRRDVDTPEEYQELLEWNYKRGEGYPVTPKAQVLLTASETFFWPETAQLLEWIEKTGSIQEACATVGMSYTKGCRLIKQVERQMGVLAVQRWTGGSGGGGSELTREGRLLLTRYNQLVGEIQKSTEQIYWNYFGKGFKE